MCLIQLVHGGYRWHRRHQVAETILLGEAKVAGIINRVSRKAYYIKRILTLIPSRPLLLLSPEVTAGRQPLEPRLHPAMFSIAPAGLQPPPDCAIDGLASAPLAPSGTRRCAECRGCRVHIGGRLDRLRPLCCGGMPAGADISALAVVLAFSGSLC